MCPTKNNIQCLASRVCLDISSLPFCAAHICTLHLAELLSMCVLTQSLDCSICHPLCIWCASLAFHVLLFHILIYIYILIYILIYIDIYWYILIYIYIYIDIYWYILIYIDIYIYIYWYILIYIYICVVVCVCSCPYCFIGWISAPGICLAFETC